MEVSNFGHSKTRIYSTYIGIVHKKEQTVRKV